MILCNNEPAGKAAARILRSFAGMGVAPFCAKLKLMRGDIAGVKDCNFRRMLHSHEANGSQRTGDPWTSVQNLLKVR